MIKLQAFIKKLGEKNQKALGNGRLDCCKMNKEKSPQRPNIKKEK